MSLRFICQCVEFSYLTLLLNSYCCLKFRFQFNPHWQALGSILYCTTVARNFVWSDVLSRDCSKKNKKEQLVANACCSWKSGKVKTAYKNRYIHANVAVDMFDSNVCAATVLRFVASNVCGFLTSRISTDDF